MGSRKFVGKSKKEALVEMCKELGPDAVIEEIEKISLDDEISYRVTASPLMESNSEKTGPRGKQVLAILAFAVIGILVAGYLLWPWLSGLLIPEKRILKDYDPAIAVLPFKNVGEDKDYPHFGEGLAEDIISGLINLQGFKIISRSSSFTVEEQNETVMEMGADLGVATILKGTYRIDKGKLKIVASLIDVEDGSYIWTNTYNRQLSDLFKIQEEISFEIINALKLELGLEENKRIKSFATRNLEASNKFHAGWFYLDQRTKASFIRAIRSFRSAIAIDDTFARAYYGLAFSYYLQGSYHFEEPIQAFQKGLDQVEKAIWLDPDLGEAFAIRAVIRRDLKLNWQGAETDFIKAISLSPGSARAHHWYGNFLGDLGRFKEAEEQLLKARELEPISRQINLDLAVAMIDRMEYEAALQQLKMTTEMFPEFLGAHHLYLITLFRKGFLEETLAEFKRFNKVVGQTDVTSELEDLFYEKGFYVASTEFLKKFGDTVGPHEKAALHMVLGDGDKAIDFLEEAFRIRSGRVFHLKSEPVFVPLHDHPRFLALVKKMKLE